MQLLIHGQATEFRTIPRGSLFRFGHGEEIGTAIKTQLNDLPAAVMLYGAGFKAFTRIGHEYFDQNPLIFSMPAGVIVSSPNVEDMVISSGGYFDAGKIYTFPDGGGTHLAWTNDREGGGALLDIDTGVSEPTSRAGSITISRWALVVTIFNKPHTLFTFPDPTQPLTFA